MKKIIAFLLVVLMLFSMVACSNETSILTHTFKSQDEEIVFSIDTDKSMEFSTDEHPVKFYYKGEIVGEGSFYVIDYYQSFTENYNTSYNKIYNREANGTLYTVYENKDETRGASVVAIIDYGSEKSFMLITSQSSAENLKAVVENITIKLQTKK